MPENPLFEHFQKPTLAGLHGLGHFTVTNHKTTQEGEWPEEAFVWAMLPAHSTGAEHY